MSSNTLTVDLAERDDQQVRVTATNICTTRVVILAVWEPTAGPMGPHSCFTSLEAPMPGAPAAADGAFWFGKMVSRWLSAALEALPAGSDERIAAVRDRRQQLEAASVDAIMAALDEAGLSRRVDREAQMQQSSGELELTFPTAEQAAGFARRFGFVDVPAPAAAEVLR
ncbi:MAG: hypothetical protein GY715_12990 [Planctomycetes bacterium]|nr:hypothetical protein [Planctomycetota bacterium]